MCIDTLPFGIGVNTEVLYKCHLQHCYIPHFKQQPLSYTVHRQPLSLKLKLAIVFNFMMAIPELTDLEDLTGLIFSLHGLTILHHHVTLGGSSEKMSCPRTIKSI